MGKKLENFQCEETEEGKLLCVGQTSDGECNLELVPDGHGSYKLKRQAGDPEACGELEELVLKRKT